MILFAIVRQSDGVVVSHGFCAADDFSLQPVPAGCDIVERPPTVLAGNGWKRVAGEWIQEATP